jgi:hypothetical protein
MVCTVSRFSTAASDVNDGDDANDTNDVDDANDSNDVDDANGTFRL